MGIVILAAGASARLGAPKQLLRLGGQSLLERATRTALASGCEPVVVVLGARADEIRQEIKGLAVQTVENTGWADGMGGSIRIGLRALLDQAPDLSAAIMILCDQPLLSSQHLIEMVRLYEESRAPLVTSEYGGRMGVPALFDRALFPQLLALQGPEGAKSVIRARRDRAMTLPFPEGELDVDTPADFERVCGIIAREASSPPGRSPSGESPIGE